MKKNIRDKVWLITGCSSGFGWHLAKKVIDSGYKLAVTARNTNRLLDLVKEHEDSAIVFKLDVTDSNQITSVVQKTIDTFGRIDVLVNNAGISYYSSFEEAIEEEARKMFESNFWGLVHMTKAVLPQMRSQKFGHIINFSSLGGLISFPSLSYYHATKYAVEGISESLSKELESLNIHVTIIEPGSFRTNLNILGRPSVTRPQIPEYKETVNMMIDRIIAGNEPGDPVKAAEAIVKVAETEKPPLRLLLAGLAYHAAKQKFTEFLQLIDDWKEITLNADLDK